ncbi:MAG: TonB family protein [Bryobacterales bacterium]|nr:TonB family protein [Bryobacterales bacterium]
MRRILFTLFVFAATLPAATVKGRVYDQSGAAVPRATVQLVNLVDSSQVYKVTSSGDGSYQIESVVAGKYEVQALAQGFAFWRRPNLNLQANSEVPLNVILRVGQIQEEMTVEGAGESRQSGPKRIRVGGNVQATKVVNMVKPVYPAQARAEGREGTVTFMAIIDKEGNIKDLVEMTGGDVDLANAAREAVLQWKYQPTLLNGMPVEVSTMIDINFRLK